MDGKAPSPNERLKISQREVERKDLWLNTKKECFRKPSDPAEFTFFNLSRPDSISAILKKQLLGR